MAKVNNMEKKKMLKNIHIIQDLIEYALPSNMVLNM